MDLNHWPALAWLFIALMFGAFVASLGLLMWSVAFWRQKPRWLLDAMLLGFSALILVTVMMVFIASTARLSKEPQKLIGGAVMVAVSLPLVWASNRFLNRKTRP